MKHEGFFHDQVEMAYHDEQVWIDAGLTDLIQVLWDFGFRTQFCCEGIIKEDLVNPRKFMGSEQWFDSTACTCDAHIVFPTVMEGVRFISQTAKRMWVPWDKDMTKEQKSDKFHGVGTEFERMQLQVVNPYDVYDPTDHLRANVSWPKHLTTDITKAWIG